MPSGRGFKPAPTRLDGVPDADRRRRFVAARPCYHDRVQLPVLQHADAIRAAVRASGRLILSAPPGTGKSTQVPGLLAADDRQVVVLQPRRIAARSLAHRVAAEAGEAVGGRVGYQVRFEQAHGPETRILFQTYGVFWQRLLGDPTAAGVGVVVLDEFHERSLEADAVLAWLTRLQATQRPDLALVVMSATLEVSALRAHWPDAPSLAVDGGLHPVTVEHLPPRGHEPVWEGAVRAFRHLLATGERGSVLVFMPGTHEIRRTLDALGPVCAEAGYEALALHGAQGAAEQQRVLAAPAERPCVVVATNVAETSLTIPGVTAVIDSGLARQASHDAERGLDVLTLGRVALSNMTQRAGRAGRLGPGRCVRLWPRSLESSLPEALPPELARRDLARLALEVAALPGEPAWLEPPPPDRWAFAREHLRRLGALDEGGHLTALGRRLTAHPVAPALARVLEAAREAGVVTLVAAMVAVLEAADRRAIADEGDLYLLGLDLVAAAEGGGIRRAGWAREVVETWRQLTRQLRPEAPDRALARLPEAEAADRRERVTRCWLAALADRLAARQGPSYVLADGRRGVLGAGRTEAAWVLALSLHEQATGGGRQATIPLYLPVDPAWTEAAEAATPTVVVTWDAARERVVQERVWVASGLPVRREPLPAADWDRAAAEALIAGKLLAGEVRLAARDEDVEQLVRRIRRAAEVWPELGAPALGDDDWEVLYHELARGKAGPAAITRDELVAVLREYVGWPAIDRLERAAPRTWRLPSGRQARLTFPEDGPPELSARLGDMIGLTGTLALFEGRLPVCFDILAPNFRTVQKTFDMTGFWERTYPEVKKELRRRYPKHPWP
jgi:ATP-dependent helicase HrpB